MSKQQQVEESRNRAARPIDVTSIILAQVVASQSLHEESLERNNGQKSQETHVLELLHIQARAAMLALEGAQCLGQ